MLKIYPPLFGFFLRKKPKSERPQKHLNPKTACNKLLTNALTKYGTDAFCLVICEVLCSSSEVKRDDLMSVEQTYLDCVPFKYNILDKANSVLGYRHTPECLALIKEAALSREKGTVGKGTVGKGTLGKVCTPETREKIRAGRLLSGYITPGKPVILVNILTKEVLNFSSSKEVASYLGCTTGLVCKSKQRGHILKKLYNIYDKAD